MCTIVSSEFSFILLLYLFVLQNSIVTDTFMRRTKEFHDTPKVSAEEKMKTDVAEDMSLGWFVKKTATGTMFLFF